MSSDQIHLQYIQTLTTLLRNTSHSSNRMLLLFITVAFLLAAASTGVMSLGDTVQIFGLELRFRPWLVYMTGTLLVSAMWMYVFALELYAQLLRYRIRKGYEYLDFERPRQTGAGDEFLSGPGFFTTTFSKSRFRHTLVSKITQATSAIALLGVITLVPVSVQTLATGELVRLYGIQWWIVVVQGTIILVSIGYIITAFGKFLEQKRRWGSILRLE